MARFQRLFFALLLLCSFPSWSLVPLAPASTQYSVQAYGKDSGWQDTLALACTGVRGASQVIDYAAYTVMSSVPRGSIQCTLTVAYRTPNEKRDIEEIKTAAVRSVPAACPANSTQSGSACACNSGFEEKNGQCVKPDACSGLAAYCTSVKGGVAMFEKPGQVDMSKGSCLKAPDFQSCGNGCATSAVGMGVQYRNNAGQWMSSQELKVTGGTCAVPPDSAQPTQKDSDCAGAVGEVNGVKKCIPSEASKGDTKEKATEKADGSKETVKTETKCENGVCETTKTTTKTGADGSTSTETSKTAQDQNTYCSKNPTSTVCAAANGGKNPGSGGSGSGSGSGSGNGSGNGNGNGTCTGDKCEGNGNGSGNGSTTVEVPDIEVKKLYERKYPEGIKSAWNSSGIKTASAKFESLAGAFAPPWRDVKGQCQSFGMNIDVGFFNFGRYDFSPPCSIWLFIWVCMQIGALFMFRALVFGG